MSPILDRRVNYRYLPYIFHYLVIPNKISPLGNAYASPISLLPSP